MTDITAALAILRSTAIAPPPLVEISDDWQRPKPTRTRKRRPSIASVTRQLKRAGVEIAGYEVRPDGTVIFRTGKPVGDIDISTPIDRGEWN